MKHDFRYFFREGIRNMFSHGFMSFAAIGVTVACLVIMGTFSLVAYNANENLKDLQKENAVLAFVDENLSDNEAKALQSTLEKIPGAADCTFVSRQEARDSYVEQYDEDDLYSNLDPSIFRHRYVIHLTDAAQMQQVVSDLEATPGASTNHMGVDIGASYGSAIYAVKSGTVVGSKYSWGGYGNYVEIDHGNGNFTLYAHMSERLVEVGEHVEQGEVIGLCGSTGISTGPHVHYEIWENYSRINPLNRLPGRVYI